MELTLSTSTLMGIAAGVTFALSLVMFFVAVLVNHEICKVTDNPVIGIYWKMLVTALIFSCIVVLLFLVSMYDYLSSGTL